MTEESLFLIRHFAKQIRQKLEAIVPYSGDPRHLQFQIDLLKAHGAQRFARRIEKLEKDLKLLQKIEQENKDKIALLKEELEVYEGYLNQKKKAA